MTIEQINKKLKKTLKEAKKTNVYYKGFLEGWKVRGNIENMSEKEKVNWAKKKLFPLIKTNN